MNLRNLTKITFLSLITFPVFAQQLVQSGCSVGLEDGALIKNRMLENRRNISAEEIAAFQNQRAITYIPVKYTIVGDNAGSGYVDIDQVFDMHCDMNDDYRTQDVQFVLKDANNSVRYSNNTNVYNDGSGFAASSFMISNKVANCINIYLSASVNNQVASYYSGFGDYIFVLNQMANGSSSTGSHEVGHFFSLPHTFLGWEGTEFNNATAPNSVGGDPVERVARSGSGSNCATAADGFCDTPADYLSYRAFCPYTGGGRDPQGVLIDPTESLIMSYFADACVDSFTQEQKNAMAADILSRNWSNLAAPNPSAALSGTSVSATAPANGSAFPLSGNVTLSWAAVPNATGYVVVLERTLFGTPIETIQKSVVYGTTSLVIPASKLTFPRQYTWKVKPFNQYQTCAGYSAPFGFTTQAPATAVENFASAFDLKILSNPLSNSSAELLLNVPNPTIAALNIYAMDGKQVLNVNNLELNAGDNVEMVDVSNLNNGVYIVVVTTPIGSVQQKMVIQK
jgi:hypothetical protein